jgi:hypothetical protein
MQIRIEYQNLGIIYAELEESRRWDLYHEE